MNFKCFKKYDGENIHLTSGELNNNLDIIRECEILYFNRNGKVNVYGNKTCYYEYLGNTISKKYLVDEIYTLDKSWKNYSINFYKYNNSVPVCRYSDDKDIILFNNYPIANYDNITAAYSNNLRPQAKPFTDCTKDYMVNELSNGRFAIYWSKIKNNSNLLSSYDYLMSGSIYKYIIFDINIGRILEQSCNEYSKYIYKYSNNGNLLSASYIVYDIPEYVYHVTETDAAHEICENVFERMNIKFGVGDLYIETESYLYTDFGLLSQVSFSKKYYSNLYQKEFDSKDIGLEYVAGNNFDYNHHSSIFSTNQIYFEYEQ